MSEGEPLVMRLRMFWMVGLDWKLAVWPRERSNCWKLWKRFAPDCWPPLMLDWLPRVWTWVLVSLAGRIWAWAGEMRVRAIELQASHVARSILTTIFLFTRAYWPSIDSGFGGYRSLDELLRFCESVICLVGD
jgi:hypothetical protein